MDEYIKRKVAMEWVEDLVDTMSVCTSIDEYLGMKSMKSRALGALHDVPTADVVEVKFGTYCPRCHFATNMKTFKTCPNCGAKMDGGADDGKAD